MYNIHNNIHCMDNYSITVFTYIPSYVTLFLHIRIFNLYNTLYTELCCRSEEEALKAYMTQVNLHIHGPHFV